MKNTDLSYAAGYIDGDGCFHIGKIFDKSRNTYRYRRAIQITSVNLENLRWFKQIFDGRIVRIKETRRNRRQPFQYIAETIKDISNISEVFPYLIEKSEEAKVFDDFCRTQDESKKDFLIERMDFLKSNCNLVRKDMKDKFESYKSTIVPTEEDFAYLSGFIDAECCINICKYTSKDRPNALYKIQLQCNNTKFPVFPWLLQRFGGHVHFIDRMSKDDRIRDQLTWRLTSASLGKILKYLIPFLIHKKPVAQELVSFYENTLTNGGARHTEDFRSSYARILQMREDIFHRIQTLNKKGV